MSPTRSLGVRVPTRRGESARRRLKELGLLRNDLAPKREGGTLVLPLARAPTEPWPDGALVEAEFAPVRSIGPRSYLDLLPDLPEAVRRGLPRSFDVVGDLVLVRFSQGAEPFASQVGAALLAFVPGARRVGWDRGVTGPERRRDLLSIAGSGSWRTEHHENGLVFSVDLATAYFSPRLGGEHRWVADRVLASERVLDLCCGVGPFAVTIAHDGRARSVVAVDMNPAAVELFRQNVKRNRVRIPIEVVESRLEQFLPPARAFDRVVFNLPREGIKYLGLVARAVARGGTLHYYEVTDRSEAPERPAGLMSSMSAHGPWSVAESHIAHPYSPHADLWEYSLRRG
ncbi:MAG TPA: methyltransferase domain-containing protein [Thermoplasmata archaeon]|nr:methyltransferase domain-containing protein [Thermoplasmata archaeon]